MCIRDRLYLNENQIGDEGAIAFAAAASRPHVLPKLSVLALQNNRLHDAGAYALARAITEHGAFPVHTLINLSGNPASNEAQDAVREATMAARRRRATQS